ncbi:MAG: tetratricopeptide repeat protein [Trichodesmium sp. ALOHA_ZT_67]|nr:tetratricopeptide repeat protein [Trichodesmium sp. ALOHA_ZT_67]
MVVRDLIREANRFKREARWEEAASLYREIIGVNPYFAWAYSALGEVLAGQDNLDAAEVELRRAIDVSKPESYLNLCNFLRIRPIFKKFPNLNLNTNKDFYKL